jgi:protein-disulfide isomerase
MEQLMKSVLTLVALAALTPVVGSAQSPSKPLAVVNGEAITQTQVEQDAREALERLDAKRLQFELENARDRSEAIEQALSGLLAERVLTLEAAKRKLSIEALLDAEIDSKTPEPSDEAVNAFWVANQGRINLPREQALPQIRFFLRDQGRDRVFRQYIEVLKKDYRVEVYFDPARTEVATAGFPVRGGAAAPVTIVEFSDFECPFCGMAFPILKQIEERYRDKLRIVYRQFPLAGHPHAQKAAEASLCANDQQRFWEMHDAMFGDQMNLDVSALKKKAADLKLNATTFDTCLDSGKYTAAVRKDVQEGNKAGVSGTPTLFINGRFFSGVIPVEDLVRVIDEELQRAESKPKQ